MSDGTSIEWTEATWNPLRAWGNSRQQLGWSCVRVSDGL
jgi:protein gp37